MRRKIQHTFWATLPMAVAIILAVAGLGNHAVGVAAADGSRDGLVTGSGSVEPISDQVQVGSPIPGKIKYVRAAEGATVRKGQIVAILEFDDSMALCAAAEAKLEKSLAALHDAKGEAARKTAETAVAAARSEVEDARFDWENHFVRAPISGVVRRHNVKVGDAVADGPVVTMADASVLRVRMELVSADAAKVHVGQGAYVTAAEFPGKKFPGKVVAIAAVTKANAKGPQTLIELDPGTTLPLGSRVDAFLLGK
jgi:multidrug efflux pump subunit AcrA (membrane-fusion protein)